MTNEEAIYVLKNAAWLGSDKDRKATEEAVNMAIEALSDQTGEWIYHHRTDLGEKLNDMCECSCCGKWFSICDLLYRSFCPNCGADMRGEQDE